MRDYLCCALAVPLHLAFLLLDHACHALKRHLRLDVYWLLFPDSKMLHTLATWAAGVVRGTGATSTP